MHTEKKREFIINIIYYTIFIIFIYCFFQYILPFCLPFCIGFFIAFLLRSPIRILTNFTHGYQKIWELITLLFFYTLLLIILIPFLSKLGIYIKYLLEQLPFIYRQNILPYLSETNMFLPFPSSFIQQFPTSLWNQILQSLSEMISSIISSFLYCLKSWFTQLPNILLSCFLTIFSSFLFQFHYTSISQYILYQLPEAMQQFILTSAKYTKKTLIKIIKANLILMFFTWLQLLLGFWLIGIKQSIYLATMIALFDALPMVGVGCIFLPWICINILARQTSFAFSLFILYIFIILVRNILEPKIMGQQLGLHPIVLVIGMYIGAKLFGLLGILLLPNIFIIIRHLLKEKMNIQHGKTSV